MPHRPSPRILVVDHDPCLREEIARALVRHDFTVDIQITGQQALRALSRGDHDSAILELAPPGENGLDLALRLREVSPDLQPILTASCANAELVANAVRAGAFDLLLKPIDSVRLARVTAEAVEATHRHRTASQEIAAGDLGSQRAGSSEWTRSLVRDHLFAKLNPRRVIPSIRPGDVRPAPLAGVRPL